MFLVQTGFFFAFTTVRNGCLTHDVSGAGILGKVATSPLLSQGFRTLGAGTTSQMAISPQPYWGPLVGQVATSLQLKTAEKDNATCKAFFCTYVSQ